MFKLDVLQDHTKLGRLVQLIATVRRLVESALDVKVGWTDRQQVLMAYCVDALPAAIDELRQEAGALRVLVALDEPCPESALALVVLSEARSTCETGEMVVEKFGRKRDEIHADCARLCHDLDRQLNLPRRDMSTAGDTIKQ